MKWWNRLFLVAASVVFSNVSAFALPDFLEIFRNDPLRNPNVDGCNTCHMSEAGGDERNPFGQAFERGNMMITTMLRAQFPDRFVYPVSRVSDGLSIHFADPAAKQIVVEQGGARTLVDVEKKSAAGQPAMAAGPPIVQSAAVGTPAVPQAPQARTVSDVRVDQDAREGAFFGANVVTLPNGKPLRRGGWEFFVGHRFSENIEDAGLGGLFGFDSSATVAFGVRAGLSDRVSVGILRSNANQTISLSSSLQVSRQSASVPLTVQIRGGVDGRRNFGLYDRDDDTPFERQYSPFLQVPIVRTFKDRVSVMAIPIFAFNTRNEETFVPPSLLFGNDSNHTIALGVGVGIRFLPSVSLVGEYVPRLDGFRGELKDRPAVAIGLQKSTFRHTFELVVARQEVMTPAHAAFQGTDTFQIGFNIYRKLR